MKSIGLYDMKPYAKHFIGNIISTEPQRFAVDATVFYPTGGGQPGDAGVVLIDGDQPCRVIDTIRDKENPSLIWHITEAPIEDLRQGSRVEGHIDWETRYGYMRMHTCLHLLCSVIKAPVTGCSISADKGRLDFDLPVSQWHKDDISESLNKLIAGDFPVTSYWLSADDPNVAKLVRTRAAPPAFNNKVRIVEIKSVDVQPCGGTHVASTAEIGPVVCNKIAKKSAHNRRFSLAFAD